MSAKALFTNNAETTLSAGINGSVTSVAVVDGSAFPSPTGDDYFIATIEEGATIEIVKVTARSGNTLTVERGFDDTSGSTFTSVATVSLRITAEALRILYADEHRRAQTITTATTLVANAPIVYCDTSGGAFTVTLPASPSVGDRIRLIDGADFSSNTLTVARNGSNIASAAADMTVTTQYADVLMIYMGASEGWRVH